MIISVADESDTVRLLRRILLALVLLGIVGLIIELFLLEHTESALQWIPFGALAAGLAATAAVAARPARGTVLSFRVVMAIFVLAGVLGLVLHFRGNVEFELEREPLHGWTLFWEAIRGATPALAPGAMAQLGLLGLVYSYRHPALRRDPPEQSPGTTIEPLERT